MPAAGCAATAPPKIPHRGGRFSHSPGPDAVRAAAPASGTALRGGFANRQDSCVFGLVKRGAAMVQKLVLCPVMNLGFVLAAAGPARAHCDGLDGPVVKAAQHALETGNPAHVLIWVGKDDEPEIREAFEKTVAVRALNAQAKALADRYFFETVVRVHRTGEGAPYTGLKPAGRDLGPAIPAADEALEARSADALVALLTTAMSEGLRTHFKETVAASDFKADDLAAGREYVKAYVTFIHYVERIYEAMALPAHGHFTDHDERR
jgi:hypothetical protein